MRAGFQSFAALVFISIPVYISGHRAGYETYGQNPYFSYSNRKFATSKAKCYSYGALSASKTESVTQSEILAFQLMKVSRTLE
jgi:hypothetical protein